MYMWICSVNSSHNVNDKNIQAEQNHSNSQCLRKCHNLTRSNCHSSTVEEGARCRQCRRYLDTATITSSDTIPLPCHRQCLVTSRTGFLTWCHEDRRHAIPIVVVSSRSQQRRQQRHQHRADAITSRVIISCIVNTCDSVFSVGGERPLLQCEHATMYL